MFRKIRTANFQFPAHVEVTNEFKECVRFILTTDPSKYYFLDFFNQNSNIFCF
jgi:hypothetical protein